MGIIDSAIEGRAIERAIIEIIDMSGRNGDVEQRNPTNPNGGGAGNQNLTAGGALSGIKGIGAGSAEALQASRAALLGDNPGDTLAGFNANKVINGVRRQFKVQFNPSTFKLNAFGGGRSQNMVFSAQEGRGENDGGIGYGETKTHIELNVELIFDEMDLMEAFTTDSLGSLTFTGARKIGSAIGDKTGLTKKITGQEKRPSVQEEIEGFLGLMRRSKTRNITFAWGGMIYSGIANGVSAGYTLFNPSGKPVRGKVRLRMILADQTVAPGMLGYWEGRYNSMFNGDFSKAGMSGGMLNFNK